MKQRNHIVQSPDEALPPVNLERTKELETIGSTYDRIGVQRGHVVLITGPAGVGKSALAARFLAEARARGAVLLQTACRRNTRPAGPIQTLVRHASALAQTPEAGTPGGRGFDFNRILAKLAHPGLEKANLYDTLLDGLAVTLENISGRAPVVLLFDDIYQADATTANLVSRLVGRLAPVEDRIAARRFRGLILVTARSRGDLPGLWLEGTSHSIVKLGNLDESDLSSLLTREDTVRRLVELTGGHPGRLRSLLAWGTTKPQKAVAQALAGLSHHAREILACCSVAGGPVSLNELSHQAGVDAGPLGDAIQSLLENDLVEYSLLEGELTIEVPTRILSFVTANLPRPVRLRWHEVWATSYKERGDMVRAAQHALESLQAEGPIDEFIETLLDAIRDLQSLRAVEQAVDISLTAIRRLGPLLAGRTDEENVVFLLDETMKLIEGLGRLEDGIDVIAELVRQSDSPKMHWRLGRLLLLSGDPHKARIEFSWVTRTGRAEPKLLASAWVDMGEAALALGEVSEAQHMHERARRIMAKSPDSHEVAAAERILLGKILLATSSWKEADRVLAQAVELAQGSPDEQTVVRALVARGIAALRAGDTEAARNLYAGALDEASRNKCRRLEAYCQQNLGVLAHWNRDYKAALHWFHEAAATLSGIGNRSVAAWVAVDIGDLYLELGALELANTMATTAAELLEGQDAPVAALYHKVLQARLHAEDGFVLKAKRLLMQAGHMAKNLGRRDDEAAVGIELAKIEHRLGDKRTAQEILSSIPEPTGRKVRARYLFTKGEILEDTEPQEAERLLRLALADFEEAEDPDGIWKTMSRLSRLASVAGRKAQARQWRRTAGRIESRVRKTVPKAYADSYLSASFRAEYLELVDPMKETPNSLSIAPSTNQRASESRSAMDRIVGRHPTIRRALTALERIASTDSTVLLLGESGTGKELAAQAIHEMSDRRDQPLVKVNCAALVDTLLLSELFGHERGAFTGAVRQKKGRFEAADGGTLFLDEIGDISPRTQVALLRVLQEKTFERVGGVEPIHVDVRIVCATNRNLEQLVDEGLFREDLYYRLKGIQVTMPPLRQRIEDIPLLAEEFLLQLSRETSMPTKRLTPDAVTLLERHHWPGNVRELQNVLRSAWVFADGSTIDAVTLQPFLAQNRPAGGVPLPVPGGEAELPDRKVTLSEPSLKATPGSMKDPELVYDLSYDALVSDGLSLRDLKKSIERECIVRALSQTKGNITKAAALLGMKRPRLSQLVKQYGLTKTGRSRMEDENHE